MGKLESKDDGKSAAGKYGLASCFSCILSLMGTGTHFMGNK
jgi:hypothetical protein